MNTLDKLQSKPRRIQAMKEYAHILNAIAAGEKVEYQEPSGAWLRRQPYGVLAEISRREFPPERYRVKPDTVHRFVPVFKMPAGSIYMSEAKVDLESAKNPGFNGKAPFDNLAGVLHVEIEPTTMTLVKVEMVGP